MDVKRSRSPRAPAEDDKKRAGAWRGSGVRPEMVLIGFLLTLPLLFLVFGGSSFPSSSPATSSSPPVVSKPVARHVDAGDRGATPQGQKPVALNNVSASTATSVSQDKLLGGLLSAAFDESSCQSRYKSNLYPVADPEKYNRGG